MFRLRGGWRRHFFHPEDRPFVLFRGRRAAGRPGQRRAALRGRQRPRHRRPRPANVGQRARLVAANTAAAAFFAEQLGTPDAAPARQFLAERGFDRQVAIDFGCGFAPGGWDALTRHLRGKGFTQAELVTGGLAKESSRGTLIDRFHRRLVWPIRDITGDVIGFGARKLMDDDPGPKYLNTPETPLYKKSHRALRHRAGQARHRPPHQAVVVEGYTDVMACHLAGVTTAVASCGTAFGGEHISVLRRLLMDQDEFRGEVVYTFDGDAAGQAAAMKTFAEDQRFVGQTFVAVEPNGHDPCELRQEHGDAAVRDLVARRTPLIEFVLKTTLADYDLDTVEGRVHAAGEDRAAAGADQGPRAAPGLRPAARRSARPARRDRGHGAAPPADRRRRGAAPPAAPRPAADAGRRRRRGRARGGEGGPAGARGRRTVVRRRPARGLHRPDYAAVAAAVAAAGVRPPRRSPARRGWTRSPRTARESARAQLTALAVEPMRSVGEADATTSTR